MALPRLKLVQLGDLGTSFGTRRDRVSVVLWGPYQGVWKIKPNERYLSRRKPANMLFQYANLSTGAGEKWWTRAEHKLVNRLRGGGPGAGGTGPVRNAGQVVAKGMRHALTFVPEWAQREIRRWKREHRALVAQFLYWSGENGVRLLAEQPSFWLILTRLACEHNRPEALALANGSRKAMMRAMFPALTAQGRNTLLDLLTEAETLNQRTEELRKTGVFGDAGRRCLRSVGLDNNSMPINLVIRMWGLEQRGRPFASDLNRMRTAWIDLPPQLTTAKGLPKAAMKAYARQVLASNVPGDPHLLDTQLRDCYRMVYTPRWSKELRPYRERLHALTGQSAARTRDLHDALVRETNRLQQILWANAGAGGVQTLLPTQDAEALSREFPGPDWLIQPWAQRMRCASDMLNEGIEQEHCVGSYVSEAADGTSQFYRVNVDGEFATLHLTLLWANAFTPMNPVEDERLQGADVPVIVQLLGRRNRWPSWRLVLTVLHKTAGYQHGATRQLATHTLPPRPDGVSGYVSVLFDGTDTLQPFRVQQYTAQPCVADNGGMSVQTTQVLINCPLLATAETIYMDRVVTFRALGVHAPVEWPEVSRVSRHARADAALV